MARRRYEAEDVEDDGDKDADAAADDTDMSERELIRVVQHYVDRGINGDEGDVTDVRQDMFARYLGEAYGNERAGYSQIVTRQVLEAVEWALPSLLRVFMGGPTAVSFKPSGAQDVDQAKHETDVVNHWFYDGSTDDSGFMVLYTWLKDILLYPNGYVKIEVQEEDEEETCDVEGTTLEALEALDDATWEVLRKYTDPRTGQELLNVELTRTETVKRVVVTPIAPDCCIIDHNHHKVDVDSARAIIIRTQKTRSDLIEEGYSAEDLEDLSPHDDSDTWNDENIARLFYADEQPAGEDEAPTPAEELIWVHECYMRIDFDGDGVSELRRVCMAGCKILENEPCDYNPVVASTAIPITHKHVGMGYAELVADLQELMTTLTRQLLDNIYKQNVQRTFISDQAILSDNSTLDQLLDGTSEHIIVRGPPQTGVMPEQTTPIVAEIATVLEQFKEAPQMRTGVAPQLSLDPSVLEKSTMGAFMGALEQASQRLELLARLFAEGPLKKLFQKIHYLGRTRFDKPQEVMIDGRWVTTDPSKWRKRSNMTVNVGLGFNNKQVMIGLLMQLLQVQKEAIAAGLADPVKIYATLEKLIEQANLGHASTFFIDPRLPGWKAPPPPQDAALIAANAQAMALKREADRNDAKVKADIARASKELDHKISVETEKVKLEGTKQINELLKLKTVDKEAVARIAKIMAEITHLNSDKNAQDGPVEDSSQDEFGSAYAFLSDDNSGQSKAKRKKTNGAAQAA